MIHESKSLQPSRSRSKCFAPGLPTVASIGRRCAIEDDMVLR